MAELSLAFLAPGTDIDIFHINGPRTLLGIVR